MARSLFLADGLSVPAFFEFPSSLLYVWYVLCTSSLYHRDIHKYKVYRGFTDKMFVCAGSLQTICAVSSSMDFSTIVLKFVH